MLSLLLLTAIIGQGPYAWPAPPRPVPDPAKLSAPQVTPAVEAQEHTIGRIDSSTAAKSIVWLIPSGVKIDTRKLTDGKSLYFTGPPGTYRFFEVAIPATGEPQSFERVVTMKPHGPAPVPPPPDPQPTPPNPNPNPSPTPPNPVPPTPVPPPGPGKYGLIRLAFDEAMRITTQARFKSTALAGFFRSVQSAIRAGTINNQKQLDAALAGYVATVGVDAPAWEPWTKAVLPKVVSIVKAAPLLQRLQVTADCLGEVADGLAEVK